MAGINNPEQTGAFGSDTDAMEFWKTVEREGPVIEITSVVGKHEVYVDSGNDIDELYERFQEFVSD